MTNRNLLTTTPSRPRERNDRRRTLVGAAIIVLLVVGAGMTFVLADVLGALRGHTRVVALVEQAPGVTAGNDVWIAGRPAGTVERVEFLPSGDGSEPRIALTLSIRSSERDQLRDDAYVRFTSARLIGDPVVDIVPGTADRPEFAARDTLRESLALTPDSLMARTVALRAAVDTLLLTTGPLTERARTRMASVAQVQTGFAGVQREFARLGDDLSDSPLLAFAEDPALGRALDRLRSAGTRMDELRSDDAALRRTAEAFQPLQQHAARLSAQIDSLGLRSPNGTLARMQNDSALAVAVRRAQAQLDSLIAEARSNPLRFVF